MNTIPLCKQDELCFEAMTDETKALIYYGLAALTIDIDRNSGFQSKFVNDEKVSQFTSNVKTACEQRADFLRKSFPNTSLSLITHFAPEF